MSSKLFSVLITGTSRGLGLEMVKQFAETQRPLSMLFACCLDPANSEELQALAKKHPDIIKVLRMDVADPDSIKQAAAQVGSLLGQSGLNLIINNAAIAVYSPFLKSSVEDMLNCYKTNTVGPMCIMQEFLPHLQAAAKHSGMPGMSCRKAAVVNISSNLSSNEIVLYDKLPMVPYRASKAALNMITSCASLELQKEEILCSLLHPGWVRTKMGGSDEFLPYLRAAAKDSGLPGMSCRKAAVVNISSTLGSIESTPQSYGPFKTVPYRVSKAALNMLITCASLELQKDEILCALLHPGWVRTDMGGENATLEAQESVQGMLQVMNSMTEKSNGTLQDYKGQSIPW